MNPLTTIFKGRLTYAMALVAILWGAVGWYFQYTDQQTAMNAIWAGLAVFGIRRAIGR